MGADGPVAAGSLGLVTICCLPWHCSSAQECGGATTHTLFSAKQGSPGVQHALAAGGDCVGAHSLLNSYMQ